MDSLSDLVKSTKDSWKNTVTSTKNLPNSDAVKVVSAIAVAVIMGFYCISGWRKNVKYNKMLAKAAGGKDAAEVLKGKLLPADLRKKIGDVAGFGIGKAIMTFSLTIAFVFIMTMMP